MDSVRAEHANDWKRESGTGTIVNTLRLGATCGLIPRSRLALKSIEPGADSHPIQETIEVCLSIGTWIVVTFVVCDTSVSNIKLNVRNIDRLPQPREVLGLALEDMFRSY